MDINQQLNISLLCDDPNVESTLTAFVGRTMLNKEHVDKLKDFKMCT